MSDFTRPVVPDTKTKEGTAKRNILRKGQSSSSLRKRSASGAGADLDDGTLNPAAAAIDRGDPNYDSEDDGYAGFAKAAASNRPRYRRAYGEVLVGESKMTLMEYKSEIIPIVSEYLATGELGEVVTSLEQVAAPEYSYEFVKRAITMSLDHADRERERVSKLLSRGYPDLFSSNMVGKAFERCFEQVDETEKDCPNVREILSIFLARCIVDEVLPPSFMSDNVVCNLGGEIVEHAKRMLTLGPGGANIERIWGPGDGRPVEEMKVAIDTILKEFLASSDLEEAARCIKELNAPEFMHEVLKRAITLVMDKDENAQQSVSNLLIYLVEKDMITTGQAVKGFKRIHDRLDDLILDIPTAGSALAKFSAWAVQEDLLPRDFSFD
eukprot:GSChrysophyteH1.ASY1.ANO1.1123.1 assembled CDS